MFNLSQNKIIIDEFYTILENKYLLLKKDLGIVNVKKHSKLIVEEVELRGFLDKEYTDQSKFLFQQLMKKFSAQSEEDIKTDKIQKELLHKFLENDLKSMLDEFNSLKDILLSESDALKTGKSDDYKDLLNQEKIQLDKFRSMINKDGELEKKFANAYNSAKHIDYNEFMARLKHKLFNLMPHKIKTETGKVKYTIEEPTYIKKIPLNGPVLIAPRHFEAGIDSAALFAAIPRRTFIMAGVDWVQTGTQNFASRIMYKGLGALKINRQYKPAPTAENPDAIEKIKASPYYNRDNSGWALSQAELLLRSQECIIVFPEGWANYGRTQGIISKERGVLDAQSGVVRIIENAQKEMTQKISIIPTGLVEDRNKKTIRAVFGEPMQYELNINENDKKAYRKAFSEDLMARIKQLSNL